MAGDVYNSGFGIEELLQFMLAQGGPDMTGWSKDQMNQYKTQTGEDKKALSLQGAQTNNLQDLYDLIFSPEFGLAGGTFDAGQLPQTPQMPAFTPTWPTIDSYLSSEDETIAAVADGIKSGQLNELEAGNMLIEAGQDPTAAASAAAAMQAEYRDNVQAQQQYEQDAAQQAASVGPDMFQKAGLPNPLEQYTAGKTEGGVFESNAPLQSGGFLQSADARAMKDAGALREYRAENGDPRGSVWNAMARFAVEPGGPDKLGLPATSEGIAKDTTDKFAHRQDGKENLFPPPKDPTVVSVEEFRVTGSDGKAVDKGRTWDPSTKQWLIGKPQTQAQAATVRTNVMGNVADPQLAKLKTASRNSARTNTQAQSMASGEALGLRAAGRSPFQDAMRQRVLQVLQQQMG